MKFKYFEVYIRNSRGLQLFTCRWLPFSSPKALVFLCHGYGVECSHYMRVCGERLASAGYAVFGVDYEGHGRSQGVRCLISKFDNIVSDSEEFFKSICEHRQYKGKAKFLFGDSMGGAVCLLLHRKDHPFWDGAVLVAPTCKIHVGAVLVAPTCKVADKLMPPPIVGNVLTKVEHLIPNWKIVPTKDIIHSAIKDRAKREEVRHNKLIYQDKPRLKTAMEMMRTSMSLEESLHEVTLPFLLLQGENDLVTDPRMSKTLIEEANSIDKTMKMYGGMCHAIATAETDENVALVLADIIAWLDQHACCQEN